jgi:hypothetical protein
MILDDFHEVLEDCMLIHHWEMLVIILNKFVSSTEE